MIRRDIFPCLRKLICAVLLLVGLRCFGAATITVDPETPVLTNYTGLGEWETAANFENWTTSGVSGAAVAGGTLSGTGSAAIAQLSRLNISGGPDLDLGFNDFLEIRLQLPNTFAGDVRLYYGVTNMIGISVNRMITLTNNVLIKDNAMHVYRIDLGLEVYWRGNLTDLRLELTSATGVAFAVDYLRVGDLTGDIYQPRYTIECPAAGGTTPSGALIGPNLPVLSLESKHFRFLWNSSVATNSFWTSNMAHGTLRNVEEAWQLYVRVMGYREVAYNIGTTNGTKYKMNVTSWHSGYWAGPDDFSGTSYARLNITPDGLRVDQPTWVIPHELMHCFQFHNNGGYMPGEWYEFHANYGRERWLEYYQAFYPNSSGIDPTHLRSCHLNIGAGREYYLCWPFLQYLDENPDGLSDIGEGTVVKLWQQAGSGEYPFMTLERLTPVSSVKDIVGYYARRGATYNYATKTAITVSLATFGQPLDNAATIRWQFTDLEQRIDDTNWWRVPYHYAPMQGAYAVHELVPPAGSSNRLVSVNLHGLPDSGRGADWRASFIVISDSGNERYSSLWSNGVNSVTLATNENKLYLSVAGTPATYYYGGADESVYPYRSHPAKTRFPYELQVAGATPRQRNNGTVVGLIQHANGGGYKASTATVDSTAYIGPNARVLNTAKVRGNARVEDYAVVSGSAIVTNNAIVSGHAWVRDNAIVRDYAKVRDWALVEQTAVISGNARVLEHGNIKGGQVIDIATAKGTCGSLSGILAGNAIIDGDYGDFFSGRNLTNAIAFGHQPYVGVPDSFTHALPTGLYAAYDFSAAHDSRILDQYGVTDGFTQGSPAWYSSDGQRSGFPAFNGVDQSVLLDRSLSDTRAITIAAFVKWSGGMSNQPVWYLGAATNRCMYFTPDDGSGHATFSIANGGAAQVLTADSPLPVGVWTHVAVTLDGTNATLYVNGIIVASSAISIRPDQLLAANTATGLQQNYLARGTGDSLPFFRGAVDDVRFYSVALSTADIAAMQPPANLVGTGTLHVDLRATNAASSLLATYTTWTNLGSLPGNFTKISTPTYSTNVGGTGIPGVLFNGSSAAYQGPNSIADIDGGSDRAIEVWAYNPSLVEEETMISWGHRWSARQDCAFNFGNNGTWGAATHWDDDVGWGTPPSANAWHHLVYTYSNAVVKVYVDGVLQNTKTLAGALNTYAGEPINIGCQREAANGARSLFYSGFINTVRIWGGEMTATQVAQNYQFGPWRLASAPGTLTFALISNVALNPGVTLNVTNSATDPNQPPLPLTFSILSAPGGATIDSASGVFTWRPSVAQANTTNLITLKVQNNATPSLAATQSFTATISGIATPMMSNILLANGAFGFQISGSVGPDYLIQTSTNLSDWFTILNTNPVALPFGWTATNVLADPARFYRILLGP